MSELPPWLPPLIVLSELDGDWGAYLDAVYEVFADDFVRSKPIFKGKKLALKRYPVVDRREATFWHLVSEGSKGERVPDLRRCERIGWVRAAIDHCNEPGVRVWENRRRRERRILIFVEAVNYLVVLADRRGYILPWTAYPVTRPHTRRKLEKEWRRWRKTQKS